jgi:glycosyltransferase involved in cell wall biosynthesis
MGFDSRQIRLVVFAPSRRNSTETFVRANLKGLPFHISAYFGDEYPWRKPNLRLAYGLSVFISKVLTLLGFLRVASWLSSKVATAICLHEKPDVVLAEFGFHAVRIMELVPATKLPLVVHFRGADASSNRYLKRLGERYQRLLHLVSAVVVKSKPMATTIRALAGAKSESLRVLISPSGADQSLFYGSDPALAPPTFLSVGRFVPKKAPLVTLVAFELAARHRPDLRLIMVGEGPLFPSAQQKACDLGIADRVDFVGFQPPTAIADLMRKARCFLLHSLTAPDGDQEGVPVALLEAQLSGLPVISTSHAGIPEVVIPNQTGILVGEGDISAMADAIGMMADHPELAAIYGANGHMRVAQQFTVSHHLADLGQLIKNIAETAKNPLSPRH